MTTYSLKTLREIAATTEEGLETVVKILEARDERQEVQQAARDALSLVRKKVAPQIAEMFAANPDADYDPAIVAEKVGLEPSKGNTQFVKKQLKTLQLTKQAA